MHLAQRRGASEDGDEEEEEAEAPPPKLQRRIQINERMNAFLCSFEAVSFNRATRSFGKHYSMPLGKAHQPLASVVLVVKPICVIDCAKRKKGRERE